MGLPAKAHEVADEEVLAKAVIRSGKALGLTQAEVGAVIGRDRTTLHRGIDPASKAGELAALLVRLYRSLYALVGGNEAAMRHWMLTANHHTGGVPREQIMTTVGLVEVVIYLDAIRGR